jgi:hypothetical protein
MFLGGVPAIPEKRQRRWISALGSSGSASTIKLNNLHPHACLEWREIVGSGDCLGGAQTTPAGELIA